MCHLSGGAGSVLHATAIQAGNGPGGYCWRGLGMRNGISGGSCYHADLWYAVLTGTMDAGVDVLHEHHRFSGGNTVLNGIAAPGPWKPVCLRRIGGDHYLWGDYEPGLGTYVDQRGQRKDHPDLLIAGFPMDCVQAMAIWLFLWFGAERMPEKLDRIKVKYGLV